MGSVGQTEAGDDTALAESLVAIPECELVAGSRWWTRTEARMGVFDFSEGFYSPRGPPFGPPLSQPG